jgi:DNA-binding protein YbaB
VSGAWGGDADVVFNADVMRQQAEQLDEELEHIRFSGQSRDGTVTAVVSGRGRLMDLKITESVLRGAHPQVVAAGVVEAVAAVRRQAATVAVAKMRAVFDKDQVWQPGPVPPPGGLAVSHWLPPAVDDRSQPGTTPPASPSAIARPRREEIEEENFEELDFLEDDGGEDEERGRW